ncbi:MAG TPA: sporulation protein YqfD [Candidatus Mediterraneibacter stercorigallinarum]|uniref:Sporulation protein YqfD n=1 Tax=Candidatus Mediterraneibacter stercorigallinarum TaxID=2838686 RepID=A0A9D2DB01_9FIRM|nr:sporulation protein YqfD [Candidatus Mediterraneibacter stercorigallinarum]
MIRSFIRWLRGYVRLCVAGYSPERFLNMCCYHQLFIWGLEPTGNGYEMYMSISDFRKLKPLVRKTHTKVILQGRYGFPFFLARYRRRKLFFAGLFICAVLLWTYSLFIWDIHFEGNERYPDTTLAEFLESEGVAPAMLRSRVDCPGIVKAIRKEYNDIVWVSASIDGSRLKIQIKENEDTFPEEGEETSAEDEKPVDLVAAADGVITKIVTRSGVPQVHVGDTVKKGDILVLGRVEVVNDSREVVGYQYHRSDADVFADTQMEYTDTLSLEYQEKVYDGRKKYQPFIRLADWTVSVGSLDNKYKHSEIVTEETQMKLGENFYLPFSYGLKTAKSYSFEKKTYTEEEARQLLSLNFNRFCEDLEEKGVQIKENSVKIHLYENSATASGTLYLNERVTEEAATEILTVERKETDESVGTDD